MKILCVEDGSVDIDALENGELKEGKVLVYRQGSKPPFILDIPNNNNNNNNNNIPRVLKELREIKAMLENDYNGNSSRNIFNTIDFYLHYVTNRIILIENELKEKVEDK